MMKSQSSSSASTPMLFTPFSMAKIGAALNKRGVYLSVYCLIIAALWNTHSVLAAPAKIDSLDSTFPLDLQPPIFEPSAAALQAPGASDNTATTKDSYGNPIGSLKPIDTPDGRKVVSAQGLQFEIPNYASGITEIKKPSDDLLPPFIGEFSNDLSVTTTATTTTTTTTATKVDDKGLDSVHQQRQPQLQQQLHVFKAAKSGHFRNTLRFKRETTNTTTTQDTNNHNNNNNNNNNNNSLNTPPDVNAIFNTNTLNLNVAANTTMTLTSDTNSSPQPPPPLSQHPHIVDLTEQKYQTTTSTALPYSVTHSLGLFVNKQAAAINPSNSPPLSLSSSLSLSNSPVNSKSPLSAHFNSPLSNGNFNYPNIPTDESIIERIASKYKNPLPTLDPIVVALPNETPASFTTNSGPFASVETTTVDVESVPLVKVRSATNALPDYILELNDPDIGGPVDYMPSEDSRGLKVIAWDLLPPLESEELDKANSNKVNIATGHNFNAQISQATSHTYSSTTTTTPRTTTTRRSTTTTTTTPRPTTTPRTTTTTTTLRTTTTPRTTTTRRTTTPRTTTTTTTTTTTPKPDPSTFYKLENGNSYTLPTWLQDIDDPDLDVAVEYIIPEDLNQYNHTVVRDILPPLEPFTDLNNLHVTPPPTTARTTTTTTTTTTKRPTTVSTSPPHWVRAKPTSAKPTISSFNIQFTSLSPSISSNNFAQRTTSTPKTTTTTTTTTTTVKPKTTTNYYNRPLINNNPQTDKIGTSAESASEEVKTIQINTKNPFLQKAFDDGKYRPQNYNGRNTATTTRRPSTTTTTTTTTTPLPVEKNPFEPTIPPYLLDLDYPDLGPGVPFVYDPNEDENPVDENILPPSETSEDTNKSATAPNSPNSPFSNSQTPQGFTNKFTTSAISLTSSSSIPSKITVPHPSTQQQQQKTNQDVIKTPTQQPPVVFVPPVPTAEGPITTTFNKNFAASFEPNTSSTTSTTTTNADKKVPLSADRESFPPFNNVITGSSTLPSKTTFTKSEDGKVITNNIFLSGGLGSTSVKPFGFTTSEKNTVDKSTTASSVFKQFGTTSSAAAGFVTNADTSASFGAKYTGRFGGPPGVLAPQNNGFNTASTTVTKTTISSHPSATTAIAFTTGSNNYKFTGSFGGPPGVLKPFDNVKTG